MPGSISRFRLARSSWRSYPPNENMTRMLVCTSTGSPFNRNGRENWIRRRVTCSLDPGVSSQVPTMIVFRLMRRSEMTAEEIKQLLGLEAHPREGGYFRQTWKSEEEIPLKALPSRYSGPRAAGTAIYYLLEPSTFSEMHRLISDEVFHFYYGDPVDAAAVAGWEFAGSSAWERLSRRRVAAVSCAEGCLAGFAACAGRERCVDWVLGESGV